MNKVTAKQTAIQSALLHYFNQTLYEQGVITESQRNKMSLKIDNRAPSTGRAEKSRKASS